MAIIIKLLLVLAGTALIIVGHSNNGFNLIAVGIGIVALGAFLLFLSAIRASH